MVVLSQNILYTLRAGKMKNLRSEPSLQFIQPWPENDKIPAQSEFFYKGITLLLVGCKVVRLSNDGCLNFVRLILPRFIPFWE